MKKITAILTAAALVLTSAIAFAGCSNKTESSDSSASSDKATSAVSTSAEKLTIAIPNDTTNEARALLLLQELGYIKLKDGAGITATPKDIAENAHNTHVRTLTTRSSIQTTRLKQV